MTRRRIAARHIAAAHLRTTERGPRLLAASDGDAEHAARIDRTLDDLRAHSRELAPVVHLPRPHVDASGRVPPYDLELDEFDPPLERDPLGGWLLALAIGLGAWAIIAAIAYGLVQAFT